MTKLTSIDGKSVYVNPQHIVSMKAITGVTHLKLINDNLWVEQSMELIVTLILSSGTAK